MRNLTFLIKLFFLCSCLLSTARALQENPFLTKDFANLFTTPSPSTTTTTQSSTTTTFPPVFNLPFQFTAPSSSSPSSSPSNTQSESGINWNYPNIFKYQSSNDKRQETSSVISNHYNHNSNSQKRPLVNYGKAPIELYTMMSMKKGRYFPPPEDNDGYSGLVPKSGSNVIGPNGALMQPSMGSGFAAMQGLDASPSTGYEMGYSGQGFSYPNQGSGYQRVAYPSQGMGYPNPAMSFPSPTMAYPGPAMGYAGQGMGYGGLGLAPQATSPFGAAMGYGMSSPYGLSSPAANPYSSPPSYLGFPNMQPAASSIYSAYSGYGGGYSAAPAYPGFGYGIGGYGSGMYPMTSGLLGAASQTMGTILSPFAALAQPYHGRYPYSLFPFG